MPRRSPLWPEGAPGALGEKDDDQPTLTAFLPAPEKATGAAIVISMGPNTHGGSRKNLLGDTPSPELLELLSNEKQVTRETPPCFIWHTWEDSGVKVENSLDFAAALRKNGAPFDLHIYQKGGHGMGLGGGRAGGEQHPWAADCLFWLQAQGFAK